MSSSNDSDLAARVMEVTGTTRQIATNLLAACGNDVQAAVDLFLANEENDGIDVETVPECNNEDEVRAPIAPIREQLIGPHDDNFRQVTHGTGATAKARSLPRIKVCPLRDFAREGSIMEESLAGSDAIPPLIASERPSRRPSSTARSSSHSSTSTSSSSSTSTNRLGDLFRPPTDIVVVGTFQHARTRATNMKRWLLVNVQSDNFNSQLLNRDVWSQIKVRILVKKHFLLWQVSADTTEGTRFSTFYHCNQTPYICIIDPRTGEELWKSDQPNKIKFLESLQGFLDDNSSEGFFESGGAGPSSTFTKRSIKEKNASEGSSSTAELLAGRRKRNRPVEMATELSEEEQILLAVRNSLRENGCGNHANKKSKNNADSEDMFHEISDSDDDVQNVPAEEDSKPEKSVKNENSQNQENPVSEMHTKYLGNLTDEITTLKIRLVNADVDESVTIRWPSDTKLRALQLYISEKFPMVTEKFKLISPFPRKVVDLNEDSDMQTLKDANLHPSSTLHVHLDD